ncbi:UGSC family (seleno)protein [Trujillonella endophytica]|uniref:UGSC-like domain-containing protein n=1 Tax=Trujillonella endophytica TaxID=673521 RepID=A0A1H8Q4R3_9ACTN|nr:hypothetical protein [Trujillella endophytica]SEO49235.1 hypothetical protein SAMN05660991_00572 [Trujillella endophytica]
MTLTAQPAGDVRTDAVVEIVNPIATPRQEEEGFDRFPPAPRLADLRGATIGFFWNGKALGDVALERVRTNLVARFPDLKFRDYIGVNGQQLRRSTPEQLDQMAAECDAIVGATADCGSCCSWLVYEMVELERRGVPTVAITAEGFVEDAHWSAKLFGCPEAPLLVTKYAITSQPESLIHEMIDAATDQAIIAFTEDPKVPDDEFVHLVPTPKTPTLRYSGSDQLDAFDQMQSDFIDKGWSDGLPLVPPTRAKVDAMIAASGRAPEEVVGYFEPGYGIGTVEKIAANAVMAGARPESMPVILAIAEAYLDPWYGLRCLSMSTGPQHPLILVSGPYAQQIGMNSGCCALGPGSVSAVNVGIGRASRLIMMNVGLCYPGISDLDTIGATGKFGACVAENEGRTPWEPYRVAKGFTADQTTVTLHGPYASSDVTDFTSATPEDLLETFAMAARNAAVTSAGIWLTAAGQGTTEGPFHADWNPLIMLAPDHAEIFRIAGWSREQVQEEFFRRARLPFSTVMHHQPPELFDNAHPHLRFLWDAPDTEVSLYRRPDQIDLYVVGQDAGRSQFWYGGTGVTTKQVVLP